MLSEKEFKKIYDNTINLDSDTLKEYEFDKSDMWENINKLQQSKRGAYTRKILKIIFDELDRTKIRLTNESEIVHSIANKILEIL